MADGSQIFNVFPLEGTELVEFIRYDSGSGLVFGVNCNNLVSFNTTSFEFNLVGTASGYGLCVRTQIFLFSHLGR